MFGEIIKDFRMKNCFTQRNMAERLCVSIETYQSYESGEIIPSLDKAYRIALFLYISPLEVIEMAIKDSYTQFRNASPFSGNDLPEEINISFSGNDRTGKISAEKKLELYEKTLSKYTFVAQDFIDQINSIKNK